MSFSAVIPIASTEAANATLEAAGWGPGNFSVPLRANGGTGDATHMGLNHHGTDPAFRDAVAAIPAAVMRDAAPLTVEFLEGAAALGLAWTSQENWYAAPIMTGDLRTHSGKNWESLVDYNVWTPPVAWREVVAEGYPAWVQPTGAHDAYALNFIVTHNSVNYRSTIPANTTVPGENVIFGWWVIA